MGRGPPGHCVGLQSMKGGGEGRRRGQEDPQTAAVRLGEILGGPGERGVGVVPTGEPHGHSN